MNKMNTSNCPDENQIAAILFQDELEPALDAVCKHVETCESCSERADHLLRLQGKFGRRVGELFRDEFVDTNPDCHSTTLWEQQNLMQDEIPVHGKIISKHRLLGQIGSGGMGEVYLCEHIDLKTRRAIKLISQSRRDASEALVRFRREYEVAGQLNHPHLIRTIDAGKQDGLVYLIMDLIEGRNLSQVLRSHGPLDPAVVCEILRQAAEGLSGLINSGYIHRDIKPANLMLSKDAKVILLDYGLARPAKEFHQIEPNLTSTFQIVGSPNYMAPELFSDSNLATERSDLYSLGCTAYLLLTGTIAHRSDSSGASRVMEIFQNHQNATYEDLQSVRNDLPEPIIEVVRRLMAVNPKERYENVQQFIDAVTPYCANANLLKLVTAETLDLGPLPNGLLSERDDLRTVVAEQQNGATRRSKKRNFLIAMIAFTAAMSGILLSGTSDVLIKTNGTPTSIEIDGKSAQFKVDEKGNIHIRLENGPRKIQIHFANQEVQTRQKWILRLRDNIVSVKRKARQSEIDQFLDLSPEPLKKNSPGTAVSISPFNGKFRPERNLPELKPELREFPNQAPLSAAALVQHPSPINDVLSWTIETKSPRGEIHFVQLNHDRTLFAIGGNDGMVGVYRVSDSALIHKLVGHVVITSLRWVTVGTILVASEDGVVRLWDVSDNKFAKVLRTWTHDGVPVWDADVSADGMSIAVAASTSSEIHRLSSKEDSIGLPGYCWACNWSWDPNSTVLAAGAGPHLNLMNSAGKGFARLPGAGRRIESIDWQPHGVNVAATTFGVDPAHVYNSVSLEKIFDFEKLDADASVSRVRWSPDGRKLCLTGPTDFRIYDTTTSRATTVNSGFGSSTCMDWIDEKEILAARRYLPMILKLNLDSGVYETLLTGLKTDAASIIWKQQDSLEVCLGEGIFHVSSQSVEPLPMPKAGQTLSPSGFATFGSEPKSRLAELRKTIYRISPTNDEWEEVIGLPSRELALVAGHPHKEFAYYLSHDGEIWEIDANLKTRMVLKINRPSSHGQFCWSPNGSRIAFAGGKELYIWEETIDSEHRIQDVRLQGGAACAWSNDSQRIVVPTVKGLRLFDLSGPELTVREVPTGQKHWRNDGLAFSPDDSQLVIRTDTSLEIWSTTDWTLRCEVPTNINLVKGTPLVWSPDGRLICLGSAGGILRFFNAHDLSSAGNLLLISPDEWVALSPDGHWHATESIREDLIMVCETINGQTKCSLADIAELESQKPLLENIFGLVSESP